MHSSRVRTGRSLTVCWSLLSGGGCLLQGGRLFLGGVCSRGVVSQHALRQIPPPVDRITDTSKNITLATTSLWPVITLATTLLRPVTRMHSSRMCTIHCSGCLMRGCLSGVCMGGVHIPPWTDRHL